MKIIHTEDLTRTFMVGSSLVNALHGVDLDVEAGEFVALMGDTILMVTHDTKVAGYAGRVLHMQDGAILQ